MVFEDGGNDDYSGAEDAWPALSVSDLAPLNAAGSAGDSPQSSGGVGWRDIAGKIWNAPNTLLGLAYGGVGMAAGEVGHLLGLQGQQLGPMYLPSNVLGGLNALLHGKDWHDD